MNTLEIIVFIAWYPLLGKLAASYLIGDKTFYYIHYDSDFGPFNVFKGKKRSEYSKDLEKENVKRIIYCIIGGVFSYIFTIIHVIYTEIKQSFNTIKWAFSKNKASKS